MSKSPTDDERSVLDYLKGKENPFESLVRPQRLDEKFGELHVPELLSAERQTVLDMMDRFRVAEYNQASDLPPSRVVFVFGDRGSGKTHLLRSLRFADREKAHLILQPEFYQKDLDIEEYLLSQLVIALLANDETFDGRPIDDLAAVFTRRLLRQALLSASPTERIFVAPPEGVLQRWLLLWGGGNACNAQAEKLAGALGAGPKSNGIAELVQAHGIPAPSAFRLLHGHLRREERGRDLVAALRRELYSHMARLTLFKDAEALERFLSGEYQQTEGLAGSRFERTSRMLQVLLEACALARLPVVFAFDNLEHFLNPQGPFDGELTRAFFNNLAQAVDRTRGILFLVFAENGLYRERIFPHLDSFAQLRINQGVLLPGRGPVFEVRLAPPPAEMLRRFIATRMKRVLQAGPPHASLSEEFPFSEEFLATEFGDPTVERTLRDALYRIRDEYSRLVYGVAKLSQSRDAPPPPPPPPQLEMLWRQYQGSAEKRLSGSLVAHLQDLHAGLGALVQCAQPLMLGGWTLHEVQPLVKVGEHANYGFVTILSWTKSADNGSAEPMRVAVGLLVAGGPGMPADLKAKFDVFRARSHKVDRLLVLWTTEKESDDLVNVLPPKTRAVWDENRHRARTELRGIRREDLRTLAAFLGWVNAVQDQTDSPLDPALIRDFVSHHCIETFQSVAPEPSQPAERSVADED